MKLLIAFVLAGVIFFIQRFVYKKLWNKNLDVSISFDREILYEDENNVLEEIITNRKYLPLPILQVKFSITRTFLFERQENTKVTDRYYRNEFFTVMPLQKITRTYPFVCSHRGFFHMENMDVICRSFFMDAKMIDTRVHEASVCVLPGHIAHEDVPTSVNDLLGDIEKNLHINEDPFTFAGIRDYQPYDSMKSINWKATAKTGDLRVNMRDYTSQKVVRIFLNLEDSGVIKRPEAAEAAIKVAAGLVKNFTSDDMEYAFYSNGVDCLSHQPIKMKVSRGKNHEREIYRALARIDLKEECRDMAELFKDTIAAGNGSMCDYYISINSYDGFQQLLKNYDEIHKDFTWFYVMSGNSYMGIAPQLQTRIIPIKGWNK